MLEQELRDHFTKLADEPPPSAAVSIIAAERRGRTLLKRRRAALIGGPVLAVLVVLAVALTSAVLAPPRPAPPASGHRTPAPAAFDPLYQGVSFGWLPLVQPIPPVGQVTTAYASATVYSRSLRLWQVTAYAAGRCTMTRLELACGHSPALILGPAPGVDGRRAYWANWPQDGLVLAFQYAAGGWALLHGSYAPGTQRLGKAQMVKVAGHVSVGAHLAPVKFPVQLTNGQAGWHVSELALSATPGGPVGRSFMIAGRGARVTAQIAVSPLPADACTIPARRYWLRHYVINGYEVTVSHFGPASTYLLCARNADGLAVMLFEPAWWHQRDPVAFLRGLFGQLRLLGPDPHGWTTQPLR